ncbi:MAG: GHKL domain-containing protein [Gammaproteobacteria bacterium]|nr:GHKL domain-containing protein [Gammaproteobacteria bacterium]
MQKEKETQYLMVFIGLGLFLVGTLETFRLFVNDVKYDSLNAIFSVFLVGLVGGFVLSNDFRSILVSAFRSYFYRDKNNYKLEWDKINSIVNNEKDIYNEILNYFIKWADCGQGSLLLCDRKNKLRQVATYPDGGGKNQVAGIELSEDVASQRSNVFWIRNQGNSRLTLSVHLIVDDILMAVCRIQNSRSMEDIDDASISLCETASTAFAIRLRDIQQKEQLVRQEKMTGFNKTIAFLAHDLKNIAAQQQLAMENFPNNRHDPEFLDDFSGTMAHSTSRLLSLIDQFNTSSSYREQDGRLASLEAVFEDIRKLASTMGAQIDINSDFDAAGYSVDNRLLSVVVNLVKNALEASPAEHAVSINMSLDSAMLQITVTDRGEGMSRDFIDNHLFEPFVTRRKENGLGIGMFQVQETITELDGEIAVESEIGQGTSVTIKLPAREVE